jgi:hypothetical protein
LLVPFNGTTSLVKPAANLRNLIRSSLFRYQRIFKNRPRFF